MVELKDIGWQSKYSIILTRREQKITVGTFLATYGDNPNKVRLKDIYLTELELIELLQTIQKFDTHDRQNNGS